MENNDYPKRLLETTEMLSDDLKSCIDKLVKARSNGDSEDEALNWMEGLAVASIQQFQCLIEFLKSRNYG